jgi:hypothetical protein
MPDLRHQEPADQARSDAASGVRVGSRC